MLDESLNLAYHGARAEKKEFNIQFPNDYGAAGLAGKPVIFSVQVKKVNEVTEPKLDDGFAGKVGPFKTVAELKADIKKQLKVEFEGIFRFYLPLIFGVLYLISLKELDLSDNNIMLLEVFFCSVLDYLSSFCLTLLLLFSLVTGSSSVASRLFAT